MKLDPVLSEIRAVREAYSEKFAGDVKAMLADIRKRQAEGGRHTIAHAPKQVAPLDVAVPLHHNTTCSGR